MRLHRRHPLDRDGDGEYRLVRRALDRNRTVVGQRQLLALGPFLERRLRVAVVLPDLTPAEGTGRSKRAAEQAAAAALLAREGVAAEGPDD